MAAVLKFGRRPCERVCRGVNEQLSATLPSDEDRDRAQPCARVAGAIAGGRFRRWGAIEDPLSGMARRQIALSTPAFHDTYPNAEYSRSSGDVSPGESIRRRLVRVRRNVLSSRGIGASLSDHETDRLDQHAQTVQHPNQRRGRR
jgi:hypothetical protein